MSRGNSPARRVVQTFRAHGAPGHSKTMSSMLMLLAGIVAGGGIVGAIWYIIQRQNNPAD